MPDTPLGSMPYIVLGLYLALLLVFGIQGYRRRRSESEEDYYLAGRSQGWVVTSLTIMATFFSSFALLGAPGMVSGRGGLFALQPQRATGRRRDLSSGGAHPPHRA